MADASTNVPVLYSGAYLKKNGNPGVPGGDSVFDTLANPPATGLTAEEGAQAEAQALGTNVGQPAIAALAYSNRDYMKDFYDGTGIGSNVAPY
jgi:hypothetical protein